ncbi:MAG TPA: hypothetical protein VEJ63_16625 [Planctomycetota bacterium]|nr:hypothetical protein [Planctomycetota bacterium]
MNPYDEYILGFNFDVEKARSCSKGLKSSDLCQVGITFAENMQTLKTLLALPNAIAATGIIQARFGMVMATARQNYFQENKDAAGLERYLDQTAKLLNVAFDLPDMKKSHIEGATSLLRHIAEHDERVKNGFHIILSTCFMMGWTAFECFAVDLYKETFNVKPELFDPEALEKKQLLFKDVMTYGFDVRNRMGSILYDKFDFKSLCKIAANYELAFGKCKNRKRIENVFKNADLVQLEQTRHVLVHKAGIVDVCYIQNMSAVQRNIGTLNQLAPMDVLTLNACCTATIDGACTLMTEIDTLL